MSSSPSHQMMQRALSSTRLPTDAVRLPIFMTSLVKPILIEILLLHSHDLN